MKFWIVTPSYNQLEWLKLCIASVRDQVSDEALNVKDVEKSLNETPTSMCDGLNDLNGIVPITVHHHIQDACSSDGTPEWLERYAQDVSLSDVALAKSEGQRSEVTDPNASCPMPNASLSGYTFSYASEPDNGMYDAINRGWKLAPDDVDVIAHLNCDEQYLPNALQTIAAFFKAHQKADVVFADMIVVNKDGGYICHRRALKPFSITSRFCCAGFTATTFHRASVTKEKKTFFDTSWRNFGDKVWYNALHQAGCRFAVCNQLVSVFADTGANLNWTDEGLREKRRYEKEFLAGRTRGARLVSRINGARRFLKEFYFQAPASYFIFKGCDQPRCEFTIKTPKGNWNKTWPA